MFIDNSQEISVGTLINEIKILTNVLISQSVATWCTVCPNHSWLSKDQVANLLPRQPLTIFAEYWTGYFSQVVLGSDELTCWTFTLTPWPFTSSLETLCSPAALGVHGRRCWWIWNSASALLLFISLLTFTTLHMETFGQRPAAPAPKPHPFMHIHEAINVIERHEAERARWDGRRQDSCSLWEFELLFSVQESVTALCPIA